MNRADALFWVCIISPMMIAFIAATVLYGFPATVLGAVLILLVLAAIIYVQDYFKNKL